MTDKTEHSSPGEYDAYRHHYSDEALWSKIGSMPRSVGRAVVEKAITLWVVLVSRDTPMWARLMIVGVLGYFICPIDVIPDAIPVVGYSDDLAAMGLVLTQLDNMVTPAMRDRVQRLLPWNK